MDKTIADVAKREKYWSELNVDEKIERMREMVKALQWQYNRQENLINRLESEFNVHGHHNNGSPVVPIGTGRNSGLMGVTTGGPNRLSRIGDKGGDEVYF